MRDFCSNCGESFLVENMDTCQCGRSSCFNCMQIHKQDTGHSSKSDEGRFRVQLNDAFDSAFMKKIDALFSANPKVKKSSSLALPQVIHTFISLDDKRQEHENFRYEMLRNEYEFLLSRFDNDKSKVQQYYIAQVTLKLNEELAQLNP